MIISEGLLGTTIISDDLPVWSSGIDVPQADEAAATCLRALRRNNTDTEGTHAQADEQLCDLLLLLGCKKTVAEFRRMEKWYS